MTHDYSRQQVLDIIEAAARDRGIPREDFLKFAYIETGGTFDERASRGAHGAKGLFQFVPGTAAVYGISGHEFDPVANTDAAARLYLDNRRALMHSHDTEGRPYLSGKPTPDGLDMYMAHQQGSAGYRSIQSALATGSFSRGDTRANIVNNVSPNDFFRITGVKYADFTRMADRDLARSFVGYWQRKFDAVQIPEKSIGPQAAHQGPATQVARRIELTRGYEMGVEYDSVRYRMGAKSPADGAVDCSGWVVSIQNATMKEINSKAGREVFTRGDFFSPGMDGAAMILQKAALRGGGLIEGAQVSLASLREGMVIGEDNGRKPWDAGRFKGIDHVTTVVRDPKTGHLLVSQSRGGEGVEMIPLERYLHDKQVRGVALYAADPLRRARGLLDDRQVAQVPAHPTTAAAPPVGAHGDVLKIGQTGSSVACLQHRLFELGYHGRDGKPLAVDGTFGKDTLYALQEFQREHGLEGTGVAGPRTEAALRRAEAGLMSDPSHPQYRLFEQALAKVEAAERAKGIAVGPHSAHIAGVLVVEAVRNGLDRIDRVVISDSGKLAWAIEDRPGGRESGLGRTDGISLPQASAQPLGESSRQAHRVAVDVQAQRDELSPRQVQAAPQRPPALAH